MRTVSFDLPYEETKPRGGDIPSRRRLADALMQRGLDASPVGHWTQAAARVAQAISGAMYRDQADKEEGALRGEANKLLTTLMGGGGQVTGGASPAGAPPAPVVKNAQEAMVPQQPMTEEEQGVAKFAQPGLSQSINKVAAGFNPTKLVMHDYGGNPQNKDGVFNPYHALVFPDGTVRYRDPANPYGNKAPHAYKMNQESIGLSYAGPVGSQPTPQAMEALKGEAQKVASLFPGIQPMSHGQAFQATKGAANQASKLGRGLDEASWRDQIIYGPPAPGGAAQQPAPMAERSLTAYAGSQPQAQPTAGQPGPMQVADASGGINRDTLAQMLANPYTRDFAEKIIMKQVGAGGDTPANVQEWEYFNKLKPEDQQRYLTMKRAEKYLDAGTSFIRPDPVNPGQSVGQIPKDIAGKERQQEIGTAQGKQIAAAPGDISAADDALGLLDSIKNDPALGIGTGMTSYGNALRGTPGYGFQKKVNQATSGAFLSAIQQMRGMGALSNAEGKTATEAVTRLDSGLGEEDFVSALDDYERIIRKGRAKAQQILGGGGQMIEAPGMNMPPQGDTRKQDLYNKFGLE